MAPLARGRRRRRRPAPARSPPPTPRQRARPAGRRAPTRPFRSRFGLVLGALLGLAIATRRDRRRGLRRHGQRQRRARRLVGLEADDRRRREGGQADRRPTSGSKYRLADGSQIVGVQGGPLEINALGLTVPLSIAMKTAPQGGDIDFIDGKGLLYTLNGLGPKGSVRGGKPSEERHLLLRREALELALYTFRYIDDVDEVVALLPPAPPDKPTTKKGAAAASHRDGQADAGAVLPARRPPAAARDPARRDDPAADPAPGDDPGLRGPPHRRAHAREPVPLLLPAGPGPEGLPRAGPPTGVDVAGTRASG